VPRAPRLPGHARVWQASGGASASHAAALRAPSASARLSLPAAPPGHSAASPLPRASFGTELAAAARHAAPLPTRGGASAAGSARGSPLRGATGDAGDPEGTGGGGPLTFSLLALGGADANWEVREAAGGSGGGAGGGAVGQASCKRCGQVYRSQTKFKSNQIQTKCTGAVARTRGCGERGGADGGRRAGRATGRSACDTTGSRSTGILARGSRRAMRGAGARCGAGRAARTKRSTGARALRSTPCRTAPMSRREPRRGPRRGARGVRQVRVVSLRCGPRAWLAQAVPCGAGRETDLTSLFISGALVPAPPSPPATPPPAPPRGPHSSRRLPST
jgi:hypothetical protein